LRPVAMLDRQESSPSMRVHQALLATMLCLCVMLAHGQNLAPIPPLQSHVTDTAGMLNAQQRTALENVLAEYAARTGSQIGVLLVASTEPEAIEQYGIRVADAWKLGRKGIDDGVVLIVAKNNPKSLRRLRIEAGRGVQGTLTDAQSKRILEDVIAPHFRQGDFYGGLAAGVSAITGLLDQEQLPAAARGAENEQADAFDFLPFLFVALVLISMMRGRRRHALGSNDWGRHAGVILGTGIGHELGRGGGFGGYGGGGGFSGGGGGFSGGGGGFDGGGASGDW
jgi:uncharacterized protein